jgi:hypothetical protein
LIGLYEVHKGEKPLPVFPTYKYSKPGLHEAIIVNGLPFFLKYDSESGKLVTVEKIEESSRVLRPPNREEYPYTPYEFTRTDELNEYFERAKRETMDSLYQKAKFIVKKYNDQDDHKLNLLAIDTVWSYFQDKFGTTHYLNIVGDNDSGKSSIGNTFEAVGYRVVNMTSPTAPNVFRTLGMIEPGQCTLVLDEADKIDESTDMMNILKSGYDYNKRVPKTNTNVWKQEWFFTYCLKIIIAEKSPSRFKAKGVLDRSLSFNTVPGEAELDIKEVINPQGDPELEQTLSELLDFRKLMLFYRLIHFKDPVINLDIDIKRRNRELCKPYIRLFYGTEAQEEIENTFQIFLDTKNSRKAGSIEAILIPVIIDLVEQKGNQVLSSEIWDFIKENLDGESSTYESNEYHISDHILYRNTITKILEDKFGAEYKHTNKGGSVTFKLDKLQKIQGSYDASIKIKTRLKGDSNDSSDGSREKASTYQEKSLVKNLDISRDNNENNVNISQNHNLEGIQISYAIPQELSQPSQLSPFKCYHPDCDFHTNNEQDYEKHGVLNHQKNPLLYPSKAEIEKYGLEPQGRNWEI